MRHPPTEAGARGALTGLPARVKLFAVVILVVGIVLLPRRPTPLYLVPALLLLASWFFTRMPVWYALRRLLMAEFFIVAIISLSLLNPATAPVALSALIKSNLCFLAMLLLTWTTPFHELLNELRQWRVPTVMLTTLALMYRYLPVLGEESRRMQRARASRTYSRGQRLAWSSVTTIIGQLFVRTAERAERIYLAMCARGWK